ncbi:MAG: Zn-ribbon domain-containing OB-fold protein [Burkholderiaceae bacterium]
MSQESASRISLAMCAQCGGYTFPAEAYGCRVCGASGESLSVVQSPTSPRLQNFVTVHAALAPGLKVPCIVGEVELAPGIVEEALIDVADEGSLQVGLMLDAKRIEPEAGQEGDASRWVFVPSKESGA